MQREAGLPVRVRVVLSLVAALAACGGPPKPARSPQALYGQPPVLQGVDTHALRGRRIVLDPGHGGSFGGSEGVGKTREADVNLGVALYLWGLLHDAGADAILTRSSDRDLLAPGQDAVRDDLAARVALIDSLRPDVFLSLHHNSNSALDRERNAIETYYKLDDDGPSFDLGRAIQARLAAALGIEVARLLPGNYFVLRDADGAAVLGEASYLSHPPVEAALQLAAKQRLEAEAYFLGLVDYFNHGVAAIGRDAAASDTVAIGAPVVFHSALPLEPATISVRVDGRPVPVEIDAHATRFAVLADWAPGYHRVDAAARLVLGNAARAWRGPVVAYAPPAQAVLTASPAAAGTRTRVRARVLDAQGRAVSDGVPVHWQCDGMRLLDADSTVLRGEALAWVQLASNHPQIAVTSGLAHDKVTIAVVPDAGGRGVWRCVDARNGTAVEGAWSSGARSDRRGLLDLGTGRVQVQRRGYTRWDGAAPADGVLPLEPLRGGVFLELPLVVDPAGAGGEPALAGVGFAAGDAAYDVARMFAGTLEALGAQPVLTRGVADTAGDLDRVRVAVRTAARWFIRLEVAATQKAAVMYYPGSENGARAAAQLHDALAARGLPTSAVRTDTRLVLQQTPCPAVWVQVPAAAVETLAGRRNLVSALTAGLHCILDVPAAALPPLVARVTPPADGLAVLDGGESVPVVRGLLRFEHVPAGAHSIALLDSTRVEIPVQFTGTDTLRLHPGR